MMVVLGTINCQVSMLAGRAMRPIMSLSLIAVAPQISWAYHNQLWARLRFLSSSRKACPGAQAKNPIIPCQADAVRFSPRSMFRPWPTRVRVRRCPRCPPSASSPTASIFPTNCFRASARARPSFPADDEAMAAELVTHSQAGRGRQTRGPRAPSTRHAIGSSLPMPLGLARSQSPRWPARPPLSTALCLLLASASA